MAEYTHDVGGCSVTGGYVYRGLSLPWTGSLFYFSGDYCSGLLFGTPLRCRGPGRRQRARRRASCSRRGARISSFGTDTDGDLYLTDIGGGALLRIVAGG